MNSLSPTLSRKHARKQTNRCADAALSACPCGGSSPCCDRYHEGTPATDPESLVRSRYSAYVKKLDAYLLDTWHPDTRPASINFDDGAKWLGLEIKKSAQESTYTATVEFVARFRIAGRAHRLHEISRFVFEDGLWFYVDGQFPNTGE